MEWLFWAIGIIVALLVVLVLWCCLKMSALCDEDNMNNQSVILFEPNDYKDISVGECLTKCYRDGRRAIISNGNVIGFTVVKSI